MKTFLVAPGAGPALASAYSQKNCQRELLYESWVTYALFSYYTFDVTEDHDAGQAWARKVTNILHAQSRRINM